MMGGNELRLLGKAFKHRDAPKLIQSLSQGLLPTDLDLISNFGPPEKDQIIWPHEVCVTSASDFQKCMEAAQVNGFVRPLLHRH